jgi:5-methylcytosine-specific restriction endonuclease McrA
LRKLVETTCFECGKDVTRFPSQFRGKPFCGPECGNAYQIMGDEFKVACSWPECCETLQLRRYLKKGIPYYGISAAQGLKKYPLCKDHNEKIDLYLGGGGRHGARALERVNPTFSSDSRCLTSPWVRMLVFDASAGLCAICRRALVWEPGGKYKSWITDHIIPVFKGGKTRLDNLQALCVSCDKTKTAQDKSDAAKDMWLRRRGPKGRGLTHYEKDKLIESLRAENARLKNNNKGINVNGTCEGFFRGRGEGDRGRDTLTSFRDFNEQG